MTPSQAAKLLGHAAAFDRRTVGEAEARAWAAALEDVPADADTFAAVARFYGTPPRDGEGRKWLEPHHVRTIRRQIRGERHGETISAYVPGDPDETPHEFTSRRRAQLIAIGDGRAEPVPVRQLAGGPAPSVAAALEGRVRDVNAAVGDPGGRERPYMPERFREQVGLRPRPAELSVPCPPVDGGCGARERQACITPRGKRRATVHTARQRALAAAQEGGEQR